MGTPPLFGQSARSPPPSSYVGPATASLSHLEAPRQFGVHRPFAGGVLRSGQVFAALDRLLDQARMGPLYLRPPTIAGIVVEALHYNAEILRRYDLHAFVVMHNHVHLLLSAIVPLLQPTKSLKSITPKRCNMMLALTGTPFWQEETYDHEVRDEG